MKQFKLVDNLIGWVTFAVAAFVYCSTIEPTASFWDCPEFITTGYKLEVGHPPGAPFFMLTANLFSQLVSDPSQVAKMVNTMSALFSASRVFPMGAWSFVLPALCTVGGALVVFHPFGLGKFITLVAGIALLVYGVSDLISTWKMRKAMKEYEIRFNESSSASASGSGSPMDNVKDVDYEKVGEDK